MARAFTSGLLAALAVVSFTLMLPFQVAQADMIGSAPVSVPVPAPESAAQDALVSQMTQLGMSADEIQARLAEMTPADMETLAANPNQVTMAGTSGYVLAAVIILAVALIAILVLDSMRAKEHEQYRTY